MLGNDLCEESCFVPACGNDEPQCQSCAPQCYAKEIYMHDDVDTGEGSLARPLGSLAAAFAAASHPFAVIYLLGSRASLGPSQAVTLASSSLLLVRSLTCSDRYSPACSSQPTSIDFTGPISLQVLVPVVFERVVFTSSALFDGLPVRYCPYLVYDNGVWLDVKGDTVAEAVVTAASVCPQFSASPFFLVASPGLLTLRVRTMQDVNVTNFTLRPKAFIVIDGGDVLLANVHFSNFHTAIFPNVGAVIMQTSACDITQCGTFKFLGGSVKSMNNGIDYVANVRLGQFLFSNALTSVEIEGVAFSFNLVVEAYSNPLKQSEHALLYMRSFVLLSLTDCQFEHNFVSGGLLVVNSQVKLPKTSTGGAADLFLKPHISLFNCTFLSNLGEDCLIAIQFSADVLNVNLTEMYFRDNAVEGERLLSIASDSAVSDDVAVGQFEPGVEQQVWVPPRYVSVAAVNISQSLAFNVILYIGNLANVLLDDVHISDSGDSDPSVLVRIFSAFAPTPLLSPTFPSPPQCSIFIWVDGCVSFSVSSLAIVRNQCSAGSCGLRVTNTPSVVAMDGYTSENNTCASQSSLALDCYSCVNVRMSHLTCRGNTNTLLGMMYFGGGAYFSLNDSVFAENKGTGAACIYLEFSQSFTAERVEFRDNESVDSTGGALGVWLGSEQPFVFHMQDCLFFNNAAVRGGVMIFDALFLTIVDFVIRNSSFVGNSAGVYGAVLCFNAPSCFTDDSVIADCHFEENISKYGLFVLGHQSGTMQITDSVFVRNVGSEAAAFVIESLVAAVTVLENVFFSSNEGGPTILKSNSRTNSTFVTRNCTFTGNPKGAIVMEGGSWTDSNSLYQLSGVSQLELSFGAIARLSSARFVSNYEAVRGGAAHLMTGSFLSCRGCVFFNNSAGFAGGALYAEQDSAVLLVDCVFRNNTANEGGGAISFTSSQAGVSVVESSLIECNAGGSFGVIFAQSSTFTLRNVTLRNNAGKECPGITLLMSQVFILDCTFDSMNGTSAAFLALYTSSAAEVVSTSFQRGWAKNGGIIYVSSVSNLTVSHSNFSSMAMEQGGVISAFSSSRVTLSEVHISEVRSQTSGSLLYLSDSSIEIHKSELSNYGIGGIFGYQLHAVNISESLFVDGEGQISAAAYFYQCYEVHIAMSNFSILTNTDGGVIHFEALELKQLIGVTISGCHFAQCRGKFGGAVYSKNQKLAITESGFTDNTAVEGGALYFDCTIAEMCSYSVSNSLFSRNTAGRRGGAIAWLTSKPLLANLTYLDNIAEYGADVGSFPVSMSAQLLNTQSRRLQQDSSYFLEIAPGQKAKTQLLLSLEDHYRQTFSIDNSSVGQVDCTSPHCIASGATRVTAVKGTLLFDNYLLYATPNTFVTLVVSSSAITPSQPEDPHFPSLQLSVHIRECLRGEYQESDSCSECNAGTFSFSPSTPCQTCPSNAQCLGNFTVAPDPGYWRSNPFSSSVLPCPNNQACLGGHELSKPISLIGVCAPGYKGNLCQSCADGYSRGGKNKCDKCPERDTNITRLAFIAAAAGVLVLIIVWSTLKSATRAAATHSILIRIFVNYLQLVMLVSDFKLQWPSQVLKLFDAQETVGGVIEQVYSIDCFLDDNKANADTYYRKTLLMVVLPIPAILLPILFWALVAVFKKSARLLKQECVATVVILYFLILPSVVKSLFAMLSCTAIDPDEYWLTTDMDIQCWDSTHTFNVLTVALPGITIWVVLVPLLCLLLVVRFRGQMDSTVVRKQFGFLINGYRRKAFYWEFVILYRKILIICIAVFLITSVALQALTLQFVLLVAFFLQYEVRPYSLSFLNSIELWSIIVADVTIFCGLYYLTKSISETTSWILFLVIISINVVFVLSWLFGLFRHLFEVVLRKYANFRKITHSGDIFDEELEYFFVEMTGARRESVPSFEYSLQDCHKKMLRFRMHDTRLNVSRTSAHSSFSLESFLLK